MGESGELTNCTRDPDVVVQGTVVSSVDDLSGLADSITLDFQVDSQMDGLFSEMTSWMVSESPVKARSQVGVLSSPRYAELLRQCVPADVAKDFRCMLFFLSATHFLFSNTKPIRVNFKRLESAAFATGRWVLG
ncbi:hypothetical protein CDD83_6816 [Cordyceps sp. RAO-2017]|nr:hypothetical protein CDD83_6816 [Cordyceps sp. RAO-2017]